MRKPTFKKVLSCYQLDCVTLARRVPISVDIVYSMAAYQPVTRWQAEVIIETLAQMTGINYSIASLDIALANSSSENEP